MPPKQPASSSKDPLTKTGPSPRRQKQNREAQKRYREKRNQLHRDLERRYAELTTCSITCTIGEAESLEEGSCNKCDRHDDIEQQLAELQAENMSLTAMIKQRDLFEASALAAAEQFNRIHHHTIPPATEPQNQQDPQNSHQAEDVAFDDIVWDELLNFSDTSDFEIVEVSQSTEIQLMQQDIETAKSCLRKVPSLRDSFDLIDQFASLVKNADSLFQDNQHQPAMENVRKVMEMKITLVDKCETEPEKDEALRILNELRDKRVKPFSPIPAHIPSTFHRIPGLETREATILIDELLFYLMEPQSLSSHFPRLIQLKQNILDMVSSDTHQAEVKEFVFLIDLIHEHIPCQQTIALLHLYGFPQNL